MSQALYRKWRPQTWGDVVGQAHIVQTLRNALRNGRVAHAYLFSGPRGTGKTTTARLLAKAVNCTGPEADRPCNQCAVCLAINEGRYLDLIEIDAASNTSVEDVRDLRERVPFSPSEGRFKVYIIDEVHMLSTAAFNALLKTMEEPPEHVKFVLCTTEAHKVPVTIQSRCQRFDFRNIPTARIAGHLKDVLNGEVIHDLNLDEQNQKVLRHNGQPCPAVKDRPRKGHIGFQELSRGAEHAQIRNARLKVLTEASAAPSGQRRGNAKKK